MMVSTFQIQKLEQMVGRLTAKTQKAEPVEVPKIIDWVRENLWIKPFRGGLVKFIPNQYQIDLFTRCQWNLDKHQPIRHIYLKSRQLGISTGIEAVLYYLVYHYPNTNALVIANRRDSSREIFGMTKRFYRNMPAKLRRPLEGGKPFRDHLEFEAPHNSTFYVNTAGGEEIGRGMTLNFVHASEMAFWDNADEIMTSLNQAVPRPSETWFSAYFIESTGNQTNLFRDYWDRAQNQDSIWTPVFYTWKDDKSCRIKIEEWTLRSFILDKEESEFAEEYHLDIEQMAWARMMREDQCSGSWDRFNQEYPVSPSLAFTSHGYAVFKATELDNQLFRAKEVQPEFVGDIQFMKASQPVPELVERKFGPLVIWDMPDRNSDYVMGVDSSQGLGADYSEAIVLQKEPPTIVAQWRDNNTPPQEFAVRVWLLGMFYYGAFLGIESNTVGQVVLAVCEHGHGDKAKFPNIKRYPNLYYHTHTDQKTPEETERLGFPTNKKTKYGAITRLAELVNDGDLTVYSVPLLNQMRGFNWDPRRKAFTQTRRDEVSNLLNDDGVMATAIANEMRLYQFGQRFCPPAGRGDW